MSAKSIVQDRARANKKPKNLALRGNIWWVVKSIKGKSYRFSTKTSNLEDAKRVLNEFWFSKKEEFAQELYEAVNRVEMCSEPVKELWEQRNIPREDAWSAFVAHMVNTPRSWFWQTFSSFGKRMKNRGIQGEPMSKSDLVWLLMSSGGVCAVTGIAFEFGSDAGKSPFRCSVDRIDSSRGYTADNCRAVCLCVNYAMNAWGESVLRKLAIAFIAKEVSDSSKKYPTTKNPVTLSDVMKIAEVRSRPTTKRTTRRGTAKNRTVQDCAAETGIS